jgi:hypothetical protein
MLVRGRRGPDVQLQEHGLVWPPIGVDDRAMVAEPGGAVDLQVPAPMRADMAESDRRPAVSGRSSLGRRVVVGVADTHQARFRFSAGRRTDAAAGPFGISIMNATASAITISRYLAATAIKLARSLRSSPESRTISMEAF